MNKTPKEKRNRSFLGKFSPHSVIRIGRKVVSGASDATASQASASDASSSASPPFTKIDNVEYDEEKAVVTTEKSPLIGDNTHNSASSTTKQRSGAALWARARAHKDEIIVAQSSNEEESTEIRKSRHEQEIKNEFRNALEFRLWHCLVAIVVYLGIAILAYSFVFEQWTIIDSVYFAVVCFSTVGYGDIVPTSDASRLFTALFALSGVACLGVALGVLGSNLLEAQTRAMDQASELSQRQVMSLFDSSEEHSDAKTETESKCQGLKSSFACQVLPMFGLLFLCCWQLGSESGWDAISTFYYCCITGSTVGFGDLYPGSQLGRLFAVPVILLAVGIMGSWLGAAADVIVERRQAAFHQRLKNRELTIADLEVMDADEDGKVTMAEYLAFMLVSMNKVDKDLIEQLMDQFNRLDADGTGSLEKEDLIIVAKRKLHSSKHKLELAQYKQRLLRAGNNSIKEEKSDAFVSAVSSKLQSR